MKNYEAMFLLDSGYAAAHWKEAVQQITDLVERHGGRIIRLVKWDDRKLAYQMGPHKRGIYVLCYYTAPRDANARIERDVQLSENVLRVLIVRLDKMTEDQMLRYAVPSGEANLIGAAPEPVKAPAQAPATAQADAPAQAPATAQADAPAPTPQE